MTTLTELMKRDDVRASWFYTHSVDSGRDNTYDHDVYDVVFSVDDGISLYGGRMNRRHVMFQGIGQAPALSRPNQGDRLVKPDPIETLSHLLSDAMEADNGPTFSDWFHNQDDVTGRTAPDLIAEYEQVTKVRDDLRAWLGDAYDEYQAADRD